MKNIAAIILAAGRGTRMKSELPKVLHRVNSKPLLGFVIDALEGAGIKKKILVVGYRGKDVRKQFPGIAARTQAKLLGSGDAVKKASGLLSKFKGDILVIYGDTPFIDKDAIKKLIKKHKKSKSSCTLLAATVEKSSGYGRIFRNETGDVVKIIEEKDASFHEKAIDEINVGCYCFNKKDLFSCLGRLKINAEKGEYYLTDIVEMLTKKGKKVTSVVCEDPTVALGVNSRLDLAEAGNIMKEKVLEKLMSKGVTIVDPNSTFIDTNADIGKDTIVYPHTVIEKDVIIGKKCKIGPFARIRVHTKLDNNVEVGNFVELVRTKVLSGTKIKHLTYLGDAEVGKNVNIGAGTITANYDGKKKHKTVIGDGVSIGVGVILISPVKVGKGAVVGAGSVVTKRKNVPPHKTVVGVPAKLLGGK
ncbi:MAG: NTP transferase domain-containing protein [Candidatus Omnitrophica bacterium]|nr:NTP transferase domain-containing protein [Candidatus Omnitrophota bacterium]